VTEPRPHAVLVVDDNPNNLKVVLRHFEAYSFEVYTALNGETGLERARKVRPDLILLDVQMPGIDGFEVCKRLKANPQTAGIPVIFMTALTETRDKVRGFEVGGVDYVTKPLEATELMARVQTQLQLRAARTGLEARVAERTAEINKLLEMVRVQSEQLREQAQSLIQTQEAREQALAGTVQEQVADRLDVMRGHLEQARGFLSDASPARAHLEQALAQLDPARQGAEAIGGDLGRAPARDSLRQSLLLQLSTREYEVLQMTAEGKSNKAISYTLEIAPSTVSTYRNRIMEKLGVEDVAGLIRLAVEHAIIG